MIFDIIALAYLGWAVMVGYRLMSYRSVWLDDRGLPNRIAKFFLSLIVGSLVGGFYLFWLIFKFIFTIMK